MRQHVYIVEYRMRRGCTNRWSGWRRSVDADRPFAFRKHAETRARELEAAAEDCEYRVAKYQRISASRRDGE